jgi:hypothetical protein
MKRLTTLFLLFFIVTGIFAENQDDRQKRWEEVKLKRAAFFTERIGLTPQEAEKFWPLYNQLDESKRKLNDQRMHILYQNFQKKDKDKKAVDYSTLTDQMISIKVKEANLDKVYHEKFKKILSPEKVFKYYMAERDWGGELLKLIQKRGDQ